MLDINFTLFWCYQHASKWDKQSALNMLWEALWRFDDVLKSILAAHLVFM
jgi:hypothetical protein